MRLCVACRQMYPKSELLRIVRTEDGAVIDRTGKLNGRGAYLCAKAECFEKAIKIRALERALEIPISEQIREKLLGEIENAGSAV